MQRTLILPAVCLACFIVWSPLAVAMTDAQFGVAAILGPVEPQHLAKPRVDGGRERDWIAPAGPEPARGGSAYPAETVEELYGECRDVLSSDPGMYNLSFRADARGIPTSCVRRVVGCSDDCQEGGFLANFECGTLDPCAGPSCSGAGPYDTQCAHSCDPSPPFCQSLPDNTPCGTGSCTQRTCQ